MLRWEVTISETSQSDFRNALLNALRPDDVKAIQRNLFLTSIPVGSVLEKPFEPIEAVYFPETGVFSIDGMTRSGFSMQIAMIGREGVSGTALVLGNESWTHTTVVHADALAWQIPSEPFLKLLSKSLHARNVFLRYTGSIAGQIASTALANGRSTIPERLARWMLQMHSRIDGDSFEATQEMIASVLGVRRQGILTAIQKFEADNLIVNKRGTIEVLDREGLITASGGSYRDGD